jgi:DNA-binding GntR family transcriptional regulator
MRSLTKTDAAFEELRRLIYAGRLRPGQRLPVSELIDMLDMSPTPIREALRLLQAAGLVVHEPHHGMMVRTYSGAQDQEIYDLRGALEPLAAEKAAQNATPEQRTAIERAYNQMRTLTNSPSRTKGALQKITAAHGALFKAIFEAANSSQLADFITQLRAGPQINNPMHQWEDTLDEQAELVAAILASDEKRARKAMSAYLVHVRKLSAALADKISEARATPTEGANR